MVDIKIKIKSGKKTILIAEILVLCVAIIVLYLFNPASKNIYPPCPFYYFTGLYCPGCGSLRGIHQLLHGHFLKALDYNIFMVLIIPFVVYLLLAELDINIKGKKVFKKVNFSPLFYKIFIGVILAYWVLKNIPYHPFTILAP